MQTLHVLNQAQLRVTWYDAHANLRETVIEFNAGLSHGQLCVGQRSDGAYEALAYLTAKESNIPFNTATARSYRT